MEKIFIVEDSKMMSTILKHQMEHSLAANVTCFSDGEELLSNLNKLPSLIVLDFYLDKITGNGLKVLKEIKARFPEIPVIIFSGQKDLKIAIQLINAGAVDYINKTGDNFLNELTKSASKILTAKQLIEKKAHFKKRIREKRKECLRAFAFAFFLIMLTMLI